ncbi:MAG: gamma-glutamyl-gamma-aminobutyrate hydrolase family protein [Thaumarchaeota archaeon]|nr:gamma-glutamyl-gamma-aminobutyrate hydrolase family protein [Nitrososphaerota archaeon]
MEEGLVALKQRLLVFDNNSRYLDMLVKGLRESSAEVTVTSPLDGSGFNTYDGIVISGRKSKPASVAERRLILNNYRRIFAEASVPVLGICFGAEVFAFAYGAKVKTMDTWEHGPVDIRFHNEYPLCNGVRIMKVYQSHGMMIDSLPSCIRNYASSDWCSNQALKHESKPQFGVQFHPEMTESDLVLRNFVKFCANQEQS